MRARRVIWPLVVCIGLIATSSRAFATFVTYDLVAGELTALDVAGNPLLAAPVALTSASTRIDFDLAVLDMSNLFVQAGSTLTLQSMAAIDLTLSQGGTPPFLLGDAPVLLSSPLIGGTIVANVAGSKINLGTSGLEIVMDGVGNFGGPGGALATVKIDFDFVARANQGATAIPEPGSDLLFPAGLALLGLIFRMQRREASC